jgi:hypothetical protein
MKYDMRRAVHIDDIFKKTAVIYKGKTIDIDPDGLYYIGTSDNKIKEVHGTEIIETLDDTKCFCKKGYKYYVLYDEMGLCAVSAELMGLGSKLNSDRLLGIIGTEDLSAVTLVNGRGKTQELGDWAYRKRLSYIRIAREGQKPIELIVKNDIDDERMI